MQGATQDIEDSGGGGSSRHLVCRTDVYVYLSVGPTKTLCERQTDRQTERTKGQTVSHTIIPPGDTRYFHGFSSTRRALLMVRTEGQRAYPTLLIPKLTTLCRLTNHQRAAYTQHVRRDSIGSSVALIIPPFFGYHPPPRLVPVGTLYYVTFPSDCVHVVTPIVYTCCGTWCRHRPVHPRTRSWSSPLGRLHYPARYASQPGQHVSFRHSRKQPMCQTTTRSGNAPHQCQNTREHERDG